MHRNVARTIRLAVRDLTKTYTNNLIREIASTQGRTADIPTASDSIDRAVSRFPIFVDDPWNNDDVDSLEGAQVWLQCHDYAGNFTMPSYGHKRPSKDYFLMNLNTFNFVIADQSRNMNFLYNYDERGMGKDGNALCSLRFLFYVKSTQDLNKEGIKVKPKILFITLDNCVGQNKSQVHFLFLALFS